MEFLRGILGAIGIACAYMLGRALIGMRKGWQKPKHLYGWVVRSALCLAAIIIRHPVDAVAVGTWTLAALAFGAAVWNTSRAKPHEDLTHAIFPDEE